ncbi:MAG: hypothetical protein EOQ42_30675 [Mesorhizobium sp.]|uniref:hypothetical protein n=1 Tax=unclassified Mesorhizobium TaxID=325217 RepID=UPI000FEA9762|nr:MULTISPECIES: hypothetical protein [unclassified Mesorhizobium]RWB33124.1 MAG: hypothetical protein EOQ43_06085 [Mesorhizobium sp.]RWB38444.1 MAG: hypothetical protein EOQ42_30675 [Mesorhizobium sp.]RWC24923.1 MAG: hypothetical protein EOS51_02235 [Mesorhizobium sp.]RWD19188.1 MAG: hypothetical protein EOS57_13600 [Mesorhizobium sp.]TGT93849.1 hypothetical protein EN807_26725 [Mesorhizobium sp. M5C.F.Ca.ET.164.01.1.1]
MIRKTASSAIASLAVLGLVSETAAGERAVECYEQVNRPSVYETVYENVLVSPAGQQVEYVPAIYGTRERVVQIAPQRVSYEIVPAVTHTIYRTVKVDDGGYSWEWRVIRGRKVLCKVRHKARYERVAETVVVQPERQRRVVSPAEYERVAEEVLVQPEQRRIVIVPASYQTVARRVVVSQGSSGWRRLHIPRHCRY